MEPTKVVLHYNDGRILKGFTQNFFPNKPTFHFQPAGAGNPGQQVEVKVKDLKGSPSKISPGMQPTRSKKGLSRKEFRYPGKKWK